MEEETKSTHKTEIIKVHLEPHPNADTLSVVHVFGGYTVCVRTEDWYEGQLGAYVVPDSIVATIRPEFSFLCDPKHVQNPNLHRVRVKKLRGIYSQGLLIPAPSGYEEGADVSSVLGVTHYDPKMLYTGTKGEVAVSPPGFHPRYNVDDLRRYSHVFAPGEEVHVSEKIHGTSSRFFYDEENDCMQVGSHNTWKKEDPDVLWWKALHKYPEVESFCMDHPNYTLYGEVYGAVQELRYGHNTGEVSLALFDILDSSTGRWLDAQEARDIGYYLPWVPPIGTFFFDLESILELAEGPSLIPGADHYREGIVCKPIHERTHYHTGRINLKVVSNQYLAKDASKHKVASEKKQARGDRPEQKHVHKWNVIGFSGQENTLAVACQCTAMGVVDFPLEVEIVEAWDSKDIAYPFKSNYRRIKILESALFNK